MTSWPTFLVEELADRRCLLFTGAGVSCSCETPGGRKPPAWSALLQQMASLVQGADASSAVLALIGEKAYLDAAQVIVDGSVSEDRVRVIKEALDHQFSPSRWVEICRDLDQPVIVSTNYDCTLEDACPKQGFRTHVYEDINAVKVLRSPDRLIFKIHGCIRRDAERLILARSDYFGLRATNPHSLRLLEALLTTHTALFVGYSMNDPDIRLVLENVQISFPRAQPHVMLTQEPPHAAVKTALEKSLNLHMVTYPPGEHAAGLQLLEELFERVVSLRASR